MRCCYSLCAELCDATAMLIWTGIDDSTVVSNLCAHACGAHLIVNRAKGARRAIVSRRELDVGREPASGIPVIDAVLHATGV